MAIGNGWCDLKKNEKFTFGLLHLHEFIVSIITKCCKFVPKI